MHTPKVRRTSLGAIGLVALALLLLPSCRDSDLRVVMRKDSAWATGYEATMTIVNEGRSAIDGWTVEFDLPEGSEITTYWDAGLSQHGSHVKVRNLHYNADIKRNGTIRFGFTVAGSGLPDNCTINGLACNYVAPETKPKKQKPARKPTSEKTPASTTSTSTTAPTTTTTAPTTSTSTTAPPSTEPPTASELLAALDACEQVSDGLYPTDSDQSPSVPVCETDGAISWQADLDIDCDGVPGAECNELTDPWFQPDTVVRTSTHQPLDAARLPYVVLPSPSAIFDHTEHDIAPGDVVAVIYEGRVEYAVFGDTGPSDIIGEGSYALAQRLGIDPDPLRGGTDGEVTYVVFPGADVDPVESHDAAVEVGRTEARQFLNGR